MLIIVVIIIKMLITKHILFQMDSVLSNLVDLEQFNTVTNIVILIPGSVKVMYSLRVQKESTTQVSITDLKDLILTHILKNIKEGGGELAQSKADVKSLQVSCKSSVLIEQVK